MELDQHKKAQEQMRSMREDIEYFKSSGAKKETVKLLEEALEIYKQERNKQI